LARVAASRPRPSGASGSGPPCVVPLGLEPGRPARPRFLTIRRRPAGGHGGVELFEHALVVADDEHPEGRAGTRARCGRHGPRCAGRRRRAPSPSRRGWPGRAPAGPSGGSRCRFSPAGEPVVEVALAEGRVHAQLVHPLHHHEAHFENGHVHAPAADRAWRRNWMTRHAADGLRVLEGQEDAGLPPDVGGPGGDVLAVEEDRAGGDLIGGLPSSTLARVDLPEPLGPMMAWTLPSRRSGRCPGGWAGPRRRRGGPRCWRRVEGCLRRRSRIRIRGSPPRL